MATQPTTTQQTPRIPDSSRESKSELALMLEEAEQILRDYKRMNRKLSRLLKETAAMEGRAEALCVPKKEA